MGNTASSHQSKNAESDQSIPQKIIPLSGLESSETFVNSKSSNVKLVLNIDEIKLEEEGKTKSAEILSDCEKNRGSAEESAASASANHQTRNQKSSLSIGSLRSISIGSANKKKKTKAKSLNSLQLKQYTNTTWPRPLKSSIFATHFSPANKANSAHYSIECLIAKGAYGAVYKVLQHQTPLDLEQQIAEEDFKQTENTLDNVYALKVLKKSKIIDERNVEQIKTEVDILRLCGHHHFIVRLLNTWQTPRNLFILTEFVANGELFQKINNFTLELARLYVAEIALAIEFLHNAGIIYRDAKPENILLGSDYHIKLIDFGLSKRLKYGGRTNTICGTFDYMAPEIFIGKGYGHAVDWWSLGVILCKMLTKKAPDIQRHLLQLEEQLSAVDTVGDGGGAFDFLPHEINSLASEAQDIIKRLLVIEPKNRMHSILAMQRIAMFKNFPINDKYLMKLRPQDYILDEVDHFTEF